jgi:hypothetical protein
MFVQWPYLVVLLKKLGPVCMVVFDLAKDFDVLAVIHDDPVNVRLGWVGLVKAWFGCTF